MITVIKHGKYNTCTCFYCGCIFAFEKEDTKQEIINNVFHLIVQCPDCKTSNDVG